MPLNSLLQPKNVISAWEQGDEEKKEVSQTMKRLRLRYDNIHKEVSQKERELNMLRVSEFCLLYLTVYFSKIEKIGISQA